MRLQGNCAMRGQNESIWLRTGKVNYSPGVSIKFEVGSQFEKSR